MDAIGVGLLILAGLFALGVVIWLAIAAFAGAAHLFVWAAEQQAL